MRPVGPLESPGGSLSEEEQEKKVSVDAEQEEIAELELP